MSRVLKMEKRLNRSTNARKSGKAPPTRVLEFRFEVRA
jgi:hypothetical protein